MTTLARHDILFSERMGSKGHRLVGLRSRADDRLGGLRSGGGLLLAGSDLGVVRLLVERNEEEEVRSKEGATEDRSSFRSGARSGSRPRREISRGKVGVRCVARSSSQVSFLIAHPRELEGLGEHTSKVDDEEVDDELSDLEGRKVLLPPDLVSSGSHEVVVVPVEGVCRQCLITGSRRKENWRT